MITLCRNIQWSFVNHGDSSPVSAIAQAVVSATSVEPRCTTAYSWVCAKVRTVTHYFQFKSLVNPTTLFIRPSFIGCFF